MNKELRICSCGRLHFVDMTPIHTAVQQGKEVIFICGGCGKATVMGADAVHDPYYDDEVYEMYGRDISHEDFTLDAPQFEAEGIYKVIYSAGKPVMMQSGDYAGHYNCGRFTDIWYPDFLSLTDGMTLDDIKDAIFQWKRTHHAVNMGHLLRHLTDEEVQILFDSGLRCFNWKGTKWER